MPRISSIHSASTLQFNSFFSTLAVALSPHVAVSTFVYVFIRWEAIVVVRRVLESFFPFTANQNKSEKLSNFLFLPFLTSCLHILSILH